MIFRELYKSVSGLRTAAGIKYNFCFEVYFVVNGKIVRHGCDCLQDFGLMQDSYEETKNGFVTGEPIVAVFAYAVNNSTNKETLIGMWIDADYKDQLLEPQNRDVWDYNDVHQRVQIHYYGTNQREYVRSINPDNTIETHPVIPEGRNDTMSMYSRYDYITPFVFNKPPEVPK